MSSQPAPNVRGTGGLLRDLQILVDGEGKPGGGGLLLLEATDHASAEALIRQDPVVLSGFVDWSLHRWIGAVGDLGVG